MHQRLSFDTFTPMPMRRQSKRSSLGVSSPSIYSVQDTPPNLNPGEQRSQSTTSINLTGSEVSMPHIVPSRSHSPSASVALSPPGRAKTTSSRTRYHLPSDWITPPRVSPEELQFHLQQQQYTDVQYSQMREEPPMRFTPSSMSNPSRRSTYSPIIFASSTNNPNATHEITIAHSRSQSRGTTPSIVFGNHSRGPSRLGGIFGGAAGERERRSSSSASWLFRGDEEKTGMRFQVHGFTWDGRFVLDSEDGVSGSLRWAKTSSDGDDTDSSSIKSGVQFADEDEMEGVPSYLRRQSMERELPFQTELPFSSSINLKRIPVGPWRQIPPISSCPGPLWRVVIFQLFLSLTQIIAAVSSLNDLAMHKSTPSSFGTQHVALLLVAWGPCLVFGFDVPWRKRR